MESLAVNAKKEITVDFSQCYMIESKEIKNLLNLYQKAQEHKKNLIFKNLNPDLKEVFTQLGFEQLGIQLHAIFFKSELS